MPRCWARRIERNARSCGLTAGLAAIALAGPLHRPASAEYLLDQYIAPNIAGLGIEPGVTVLSRERPATDPLGVRLGEITLFPEVQATTGYDSNVLGSSPARGSAVFETNAIVRALYDHSDTTGVAELTVDDFRYPNESSQSYTNWTGLAGGTHTFGQDTLAATIIHVNLNQTSRDLNTPALINPLPYQVNTGNINYKAVFSRLYVQPILSVSQYSYDNGLINGVVYVQDFRDRVVTAPSVILGYELAPRRDLVLVVRDAQGDYSNHQPGTPIRNFNDISVLAGLDFDDGGVLRYRLLAGYENRSFTTSQLKNISAPIVEAAIIWNPTGLTTVTTDAYRRIEDSASETIVGLTETSVALRVDHELRRDVLLQVSGSYIRDDYASNSGTQDLYSVGGGATWLLNRNMRLEGSYGFTRRSSSGGAQLGTAAGLPFGPSYSENRALLQVRFAL